MYKHVFALLIVFLFSLVSLHAGVQITSTEKSEAMDLDMKNNMYIQNDNLRMEIEGEGPQENQIIIFRGDKNVFWTINPDEKTYFEMTQQDLKNLKAQMENVQKMMAEQMKNMPEEQRKMMEQMMPSHAGMAKNEKTNYTKKSGGVKVGSWTTTHYEGTKAGKKSSEIWTADWSDLGLQRSDLQGLRKMGEFFQALSQETTELMKVGSEEWEKEQGISGVPVKWVNYTDGKAMTEGMIVEIKKQDLNASLFQLPSGYSKEESPWEKQGQGMQPY